MATILRSNLIFSHLYSEEDLRHALYHGLLVVSGVTSGAGRVKPSAGRCPRAHPAAGADGPRAGAAAAPEPARDGGAAAGVQPRAKRRAAGRRPRHLPGPRPHPLRPRPPLAPRRDGVRRLQRVGLRFYLRATRGKFQWEFDSAKNHKRQRRKRQSVTAKLEKSQTPKFV